MQKVVLVAGDRKQRVVLAGGTGTGNEPWGVSRVSSSFCVAVDQSGNVSYFSGVTPQTDGSGSGGSISGSSGSGGGGTNSTSAAALILRSAKVVAGKLEVTISCAGTAGGSCANFTAAATVVEHVSGTHVTAVGARAGLRTRPVTIARSSATLTAGKTTTLTLNLDEAGRALLARFHQLATLIMVNAGPQLIGSRTLTLSRRNASAGQPACRSPTAHRGHLRVTAI